MRWVSRPPEDSPSQVTRPCSRFSSCHPHQPGVPGSTPALCAFVHSPWQREPVAQPEKCKAPIKGTQPESMACRAVIGVHAVGGCWRRGGGGRAAQMKGDRRRDKNQATCCCSPRPGAKRRLRGTIASGRLNRLDGSPRGAGRPSGCLKRPGRSAERGRVWRVWKSQRSLARIIPQR